MDGQVVEVTPPVVENTTPVAPQEDLISRVSKVQVEAPKPKEESNPFGLSREDYDRVNNDATLSKFYKSLQADYTRKTQEVAEIRKQAELEKAKTSTWTPERLQAELNRPDFIQAAKQVTALQNPPDSGLTNEEYSALTDKEKAQLSSMQNELHQIKLQNWQMQQRSQDEQLKVKYANFAPDIVDTTIHKLVNNEVIANREDIWKVLDYDNAVQRAYQLGKSDRQLDTQEKSQSTSVDGYSATPQGKTPEAEKGESNSNYFKRLALNRLGQMKGRNQ